MTRSADQAGIAEHARRIYAEQMQRFVAAVAEHFPRGTRATRPAGGHLLWIELEPEVDSFALHDAALRHGLRGLAGNSSLYRLLREHGKFQGTRTPHGRAKVIAPVKVPA